MAARELTHGSIPWLLIRLGLPVLASFLIQSAYQLADLYFVGLLGSAEIGGMAIAINTFFVVLALGMTFGIGALALISQAFGRGERQQIPVLFQQALWMSVGAGSVLWVAGFLAARPFVALFTADAAVLQAGVEYFRIIAATLLLQLLLMVCSLCFRAVGDFYTPTSLMAVGMVLNLLLDPVLIFGWGPFPRMGVAGAALATVVTMALGLLIMLTLVVPRRGRVLVLQRPFVVQPAVMWRMLKIGLPSGGQFLIFALTLLITYRYVRPFGGEATAAVGVGFRIIETGILPIVSVGAAVSSLAGQNLGAGRLDRVRATALWGLAFGALITWIEFALLAWQPAFWVGLFASDPAVRAIGAEYLAIVSLVLLILGPGHPIISLGMGMGRTLLPLLGQALRLVSLLAALAVFVEMWGQGLPGVFWARAVSQVPEMVFLGGVLLYWWHGPLSGRGPAPTAHQIQAATGMCSPESGSAVISGETG